MCDAGVHPAYTGIAALPFIDELDWSTVDALLITHFHLDHAAALTYIMEKTNFKDGKGKVYMTHPTKAVYRFLMSDFVRISNAGSGDRLFDETEMLASWRQIEAVDFHQDVSVGGGLRFTPYHAGHVLGACMFLIEIAGLRILYTGDFSREEDRHLVQAEIPPVRPDVLICESTYGVQSLEPRLEKEQRFTSEYDMEVVALRTCRYIVDTSFLCYFLIAMIHNVVSRGGRVLLPVFVLGRAQELLLLLDEYWSAHPELQRIPIYYASSLARKCIGIYQTYIHTMNEHIRSRFNRRDNPFVFKHVSNLKSLDKFEDKGPCVMMASPGFMQSGVSRELLEKWAPDRRNGLIVTGYSVEGTMARSIINEPDEIIGLNGQKIPRRMTVDYISFSAHVDGTQNHKFIDEIKAQHIVLVHGEATNMARLRGSLQGKYSDKSEVKIHTPRNCEPLMLKFRAERLAKAIGSIADNPPKPGSTLSGLLVSKDFAYTILDPKDLAEFTGLSTSTIIQRQRVALNVSWEMTRWHLEGMYGSVQEGVDVEGRRTMRIMGSIDIKQSASHELLLEWVSSINNDMVADSALALLLGIDSSPASVKMTTRPHKHDHGSEEAEEDAEDRHPFADPKAKSAEDYIAMKRIARAAQIATFLEAYYGNVEEISIGKAAVQDSAAGEAQGEADGTEEAQDAAKQEDGPAIKEEPVDGGLPEEPPSKQDGDTNGDVAMTNGYADTDGAVSKQGPPSLEELIGGSPRQALRVYLDDKVAILDLDELAVYSRSDALRKRVLHLVALADRTATSTNDAFRDEMEGADGAVEELFMGVHSIPVEPGEANGGERVETRGTKKLKLEG